MWDSCSPSRTSCCARCGRGLLARPFGHGTRSSTWSGSVPPPSDAPTPTAASASANAATGWGCRSPRSTGGSARRSARRWRRSRASSGRVPAPRPAVGASGPLGVQRPARGGGVRGCRPPDRHDAHGQRSTVPRGGCRLPGPRRRWPLLAGLGLSHGGPCQPDTDDRRPRHPPRTAATGASDPTADVRPMRQSGDPRPAAQRAAMAPAPTLPPGTTVAVTGATGFIGGRLVEHLAEQGAVVTGLLRDAAAGARLHRAGANTARARPRRPRGRVRGAGGDRRRLPLRLRLGQRRVEPAGVARPDRRVPGQRLPPSCSCTWAASWSTGFRPRVKWTEDTVRRHRRGLCPHQALA